MESNIYHYNIYKGTSEDFTPGPTNLYASPADTFFYDGQWKWMPYVYYKVTAMNSSRQESGFALLRSEDVTGVESSEVPKVTYLAQNYPNPFNPTTRIEFGLDARATISLRIYDVAGRLIRVLVEGNRLAGKYKETWDGRETRGKSVASGIYFYRLDAGRFTQTKKMVLLR
jgi:hypothetical protein